MDASAQKNFPLPPEQRAIRDKCFHPSGTFVEFPIEDVETSIPARFEKIVRLHPERIAVETDDESISYETLNRAANRLANQMLALGQAGNAPVVVLLPVGVYQSIAIVAVLKAGGLVLLLHPHAVTADLAHFLDDTQAKVLITSTSYDSVVRAWQKQDLRVLYVDALDRGVSDENPGINIAADASAYIKYTSGSTGRAKGAVTSHRSVLHGVMSYTNSSNLCPDDRIVRVGSDIIRRIFFANLLNGATLCPLDFNEMGIHPLAAWLIKHEITVYQSFPTVFRTLVKQLSRDQHFPHLRLLRLAGEPLFREDFELYKRHFPSTCVLINSYGSTETGNVSFYYLDTSSQFDGARVPVGYPVKGKRVWIIDDADHELGADQPGEIVVQSGFLSSGYWRRDRSTTEFEMAGIDGALRGYRTGDVGQLSTDGLLTHLGRKDDRVKIRNYRVDMGEVGAKLTAHPDVSVAVVTAKEDSCGDTRLLAYFVPRHHTAPTVSALREYLGATLPSYMIPSSFIALDELPMTPSGKVDRRALPEPSQSRPNLVTLFVEPTTATEQQLAVIWADVLSLDRVGIHDNFFDLGGHSLMGIKLMARLREQFHGDFPVRWLFEAPTIAGLAALIDSAAQGTSKQTNRVSSCLFALTPNRGGENVFFLPGGLGGDREFMLYGRLAHHAADRFTFYGLRPRSADGEVAIEGSVAELAREYLEEITAFQPDGRYLIVGNCLGGIVAYEMARQLEQQGKQVGQLVLMDTACPVKYRKGKRLYRLSPLIEKLKARYYYGPVQYYRERWAFHVKQLAELGSREKLRYVRTLAAEYPPPAVQTMRARYTSHHAQKSYVTVLRAYRPKPYRGNVSMIVSEVFARREVMLGWEAYVRGKIEVHKMPGDHQAYMREYLEATARQLRECLEEAKKSQERQAR